MGFANRLPFGDSVKVTALRFVAECVLGDVLYYNFVGAEPADGSYLNVSFENIKFVDTGKNQVDEHTEIEIKTFPSLGMIWADNGHTELV